MQTPIDILKQYWHYNTFRPLQKEIIDAVLAGKDVLALLPTGGGKSVCFQVPALMKDGLCLVISPLIALMKDQVENLRNKGIAALSVHSGLSFADVKKTMHEAANGNCKFLYVSPERLETNLFKEYLDALNISMIVIDEAHCISQWGYDFRPPYLRIVALREALPKISFLALTASATPLVQKDIQEKLIFRNANIFMAPFERDNLSYSVFAVDSKINKTLEILQNVSGSSIVYCKSRRLAKEVSHLLEIQNISSDFYHAGLSQEERNKKQEDWINNKTRVIVCTNAFGMGIDKPDVRTVIHYDVTDCIENYYQEAGRAGRDNKKSYAVLLHNAEDAKELEALPSLRFPVMYDIRKIYQALADYLQIPVGLGQGNYYDFDLNEFVKNFKLDVLLVINVLKVLEQEGHITFHENIFLPSKAMFTATTDALAEFEKSYPQLEPVIKCLLRTYQGIVDGPVSIHEKQIARLTYNTAVEINAQLHKLAALGALQYYPQKETPQIYFILNRAPAKELHIHHENYLKRKQQFELRTEAMLRYIKENKECRSHYIASYFGNAQQKNCGICDVCLQQKSSSISQADFNLIQSAILSNVTTEGIHVKTLLQLCRLIRKENFWKVMHHLEAEKIIRVSPAGIIRKTR